MFAISVAEKGGDQRRLDFDKAEVTIGRVQGNDVILPKGNVSKRHARIVLKDGKFIIVDLKSTNGTYVNGRKITSPLVVKANDKIYIGDFILGVEEGAENAPQPIAATTPEESAPFARNPRPTGPAAHPPAAAHPAAPAIQPPVAAEQPPLAAAPAQAPVPRAPTPVVAPEVVESRAPRGPTVPPPGASLERGGAVPTSSPMSRTAAPSGPAPVSSPPPAAPPLAAQPAHDAITAGPPLNYEGQRQMNPADLAPPSERPMGSEPSTPKPANMAPEPMLARSESIPEPAPAQVPAVRGPTMRVPRTPSATSAPTQARQPAIPAEQLAAQSALLDELWPKMELGKVPPGQLGDPALRARFEDSARGLLSEWTRSGKTPASIDVEATVQGAVDEALGAGALEALLRDPTVTEVVVEAADRILVSRGGPVADTGLAFSSESSFGRTVGRLVAQTGQRIDASTPIVEGTLRDGARLWVAIPPAAARGACLTVRRPQKVSSTLESQVGDGVMSPAMADFLVTCVSARRNVLVTGGSTITRNRLLCALAGAVPERERIVSVEDVAELSLDRRGWVSLESRSLALGGSMAALVRGAVRMRADRLVVGEVRGAEALELAMAMGSANDGTLASIAAANPVAALAKMAMLSSLAAPGSTQSGLRGLVGDAVQVVVQLGDFSDGTTRLMSVDEVLGSSEAGFDTQTLFTFQGGGRGFVAAGVVPSFYGDLESRGESADTSVFRS